jgi:nitroimidazol reductase NimA-like FMN-containing flavoprotein (pyridoxamine 5'-phosphate oxidase superfamily)
MITENLVLNWLQNNALATIATISAEQIPQSSVVYAHVDANYCCYFVTKETTHKYQNILRNKSVSVSWCDEESLVTCEMNGEAHIVYATDTVTTVIARLHKSVVSQKSGYWIPPVGQIDGSQYVVCKIVPDKITYIDYALATIVDPAPKKLTFYP